MRFFVQSYGANRPQHASYPFVVLTNDYWDDYSYKTLFHVVIYLSKIKTVDLRNVKILQLNQESGRTEVGREFDFLDDSYCSLGQELAYYESLLTLPEGIRNEYLTALRDAAADASIRKRFEHEEGFATSLLRWGTAERALEDAPAILLGSKESEAGLELSFHTRFGANDFSLNLNYCRSEDLPGRINAIIGYNGTGKTRLLSNLAWVSRADRRSRNSKEMIERYGYFKPEKLRFGGVVAISYSAFDTFDLPSSNREETQFGYTYCGLRRHSKEDDRPGLKEVQDIAVEIASAIARIDTPDRRKSLEDALQPLREEPSFKRAGYELNILSDNEWREEFDLLSSGHKISVNIIVQLIGALQQRSLVLIDEPESHLHPPLLAALMRGITIALESHKSFAVIATHSPVVLQEILGCYSHVLRRYGDRNSVEEPEIETFGENIGLLTRHVFNLDNSRSDHVGVLKELASHLSIEEIEELFENGLSSQARALIMQARHE